MKVVLFMAVSANGIIARENNAEDFLSEENWKTFAQLAKRAGCIIWGRKTNEVVQSWEEHYQKDIDGVRKVIVSGRSNGEEGEVAASPKEAIKLLSEAGFEEAILSGGAKLNTSFAKEGLIDEVILNVDSVFVGRGIPVFEPAAFDLNLKLLGVDQINENIVQLHYKAER